LDDSSDIDERLKVLHKNGVGVAGGGRAHKACTAALTRRVPLAETNNDIFRSLERVDTNIHTYNPFNVGVYIAA
jgi:hypothetical protein